MSTVSSGQTKNVSSGTSTSDDIILSGGTEYVGQFNVFTGGSATSTIVNGGSIFYEGGGTGSDLLVQSSGHAAVDNGATLSNGTVRGGAVLSAYYQGNTSNATSGSAHLYSTTVNSGGELQVRSGAAATATTVNSGGVEYVGRFNIYGGGTDTSGTVNGGQLYVEANGIAQSLLVESGGTAYVDNSGVISAATVENGGVISAFYQGNNGRDYAGSAISTTINSGGTLAVASGATSTDAHVYRGGTETLTQSGAIVRNTTLDQGGSINFAFLGGTISSASISSNGVLSAVSNNGSSTTLQLSGSYASNDHFETNGDSLTLVCFLAGAMIETPTGERPVETLRQGDLVTTFTADTITSHPVTWAGQAHRIVQTHLPHDDDAGYPVRIRAGALQDGIPSTDLLVTPEHCLFLEGNFIPVRMLVNGCSILYDRFITSYDYFHIETAHHAIIRANGALTESFLDTGHRRTFHQHGNILRLDQKHHTWEQDAAAPLATSQSIIEPLYRAIQARATTLEYPENIHTRTLQNDPELHLITNEGHSLSPLRNQGGFSIFAIPHDVETVRLKSLTARPADIEGPFIDDRRDLGVLIGQIRCYTPTTTLTLEHHLHDEKLPGWSVVESTPCRWTLGEAVLPLQQGTGGCILAIQILQAGPYEVMSQENDDRLPLRA